MRPTSSDERFELLLAEGVALDVDAAKRMLDMGTGDGSVLRSLAPLPALTVAYEE
jgi:cyclopropane fatty-acyl-phospholipid synthase-like methyltransferase